jgi:uncharacterized cupredoxin-like copper-binding protein
MGKRWQRTAVVGCAVVIALGGTACAGNDSPSAAPTTKAPGTPLKATEKEYAIALDSATVAAGRIRLTVHNAGTIEHELVAFGTDLPEGDLPLVNGSVDEEGAGITHIDPEAEDIPADGSKTITMNLKAGRYVVLCNVPGHYKLGMHTVLTVS